MEHQENYYYFHFNIGDEIQDMIPGPRIVCLQFKNISHPDEVAEGPYLSIAELKKQSKGYRELLKANQKRAEKICKPEFVIQVQNMVAVPLNIDPAFIKNVYRILQHSSNGKVSKDNVLGIHLYDPNKINLLEVLNEDESGIFVARISVWDELRSRFVNKENVTTFFPRSWDLQKLIFEVYPAYMNRKLISDRVYRGKTYSNITVEMIIDRDDTLLTIYPIPKYQSKF